MRIVSQPGMWRRLLYRYPNWSVAPIDVWIAQPPENAVQTEVRLTRESAPPCDMQVVGENRIARYRLRPFQTLALDWAFQTLEPALLSDTSGTIPPLGLALREWYLRASPLVSQAPEIVAEAVRLKATATDPEDVVRVARAFFDELVRHYTYVYPPKRRGALTMRGGGAAIAASSQPSSSPGVAPPASPRGRWWGL